MSDTDEWFWGGYLTFLVESGAITEDTPKAEVEALKADFMTGLHSDIPDEANA